MAELKTKPNRKSVQAFLEAQSDPQRRKDCRALLNLMQGITGPSLKCGAAVLLDSVPITLNIQVEEKVIGFKQDSHPENRA